MNEDLHDSRVQKVHCGSSVFPSYSRFTAARLGDSVMEQFHAKIYKL